MTFLIRLLATNAPSGIRTTRNHLRLWAVMSDPFVMMGT